MLVLTRKKEQAVQAGDVEVAVLRIHAGSVVLGFRAARSTKIVRSELLRPGPGQPGSKAA